MSDGADYETAERGTIVVDTREKKPYTFPGVEDTVVASLDVGDYTRKGFEDIFAVERKTLDDLANSLGTDRDRFEAEVRRAQQMDEFLVVIEAPKESVYKYQDTESCPNYYSDIYPNSIIGTTEKWPEKYQNLRFDWCGSRREAEQRTLQKLDMWYLNYRS